MSEGNRPDGVVTPDGVDAVGRTRDLVTWTRYPVLPFPGKRIKSKNENDSSIH